MKKVLVIEDDDTTRKLIEDFLENEEYEIISVSNGESGIKTARECHPHLIISDIMLPDKDGFNILEEIKSDPETKWINFIFLSALADRENIRKGMNLGADDYLSKPFKKDELINVINSQFEKQERVFKLIEDRVNNIISKKRSGKTTETAKKNIQGYDILIVDDNKIHVKMYSNFLNKMSIPFRTADNGHEAVGKLLEEEPALVLLDINMPIMDGLDTIRVVRKNDQWEDIPVVIISSISFEEKITKIIDLGANDYILKPFNYKTFKNKIEKLFHPQIKRN